MKKVPVEISGTCQLVNLPFNRHPKQNSNENLSSRLTGIWRWQLAGNGCGLTDVHGTVKLSPTADGIVLTGVVRINMAGIMDGQSYGNQVLFLAYRSTTFEVEEYKTQFSFEGRFTGGIGEFKDADGLLLLDSLNGQIMQSSGHVVLI